jgi:hypothetical protein
MKRDMDLIRDLLLGLDADTRLDGTRWVTPDKRDNFGVIGLTDHSDTEVAYHLGLLIEADFLKGKIGLEGMPVISKLTWQGHEFLDRIRDAGIWGKTKERLRDLSSVGISIIGEIAQAEIKKHLGIP